MKRFATLMIGAATIAGLCVPATSEGQTIDVLYTTDMHGAIFERDFVTEEPVQTSLARVCTYVRTKRAESENVILLDNGDFLQGSPAIYFYNAIDTTSTHIMARLFNYMKYDAINIGNHDIEATHKVYDQIVREIDAPVLGANVRNTETGKPYFKPYTIIERAGKRIAVIGLVTPYIPHWLPKVYWKGMEFEDMVESAKHWVEVVKRDEAPDVIIGLFHSGHDHNSNNQNAETYKNENAAMLVGTRVEGFDAILAGHDHKIYASKVTTPSGREIPILDAGTASRNVGHLIVTFDENGKPQMQSELITTKNLSPDEDYCKRFMPVELAVRSYTHKVIGRNAHDEAAYESLGGSTGFVDIVHTCMLKHSGADISFSAPLLINTVIPKGELTIGRVFSLYRYENTLCTMRLTGSEVKKYLEYSYNLWVTNPKSGHVLNIRRTGQMANSYYNLDSAAGIIYTVDVTKEEGERVTIVSMADGTPFDMNKEYKVVLNSYRANGGGGHLENGLGFTREQMAERVIHIDLRDLRGLLLKDMMEMTANGQEIDMKSMGQWKFVPEKKIRKMLDADLKGFKQQNNAYLQK